jgi:hypothetical protein
LSAIASLLHMLIDHATCCHCSWIIHSYYMSFLLPSDVELEEQEEYCMRWRGLYRRSASSIDRASEKKSREERARAERRHQRTPRWRQRRGGARGRRRRARTPHPWSRPSRSLCPEVEPAEEMVRAAVNLVEESCGSPSLPAGGASTTSPAADCEGARC